MVENNRLIRRFVKRRFSEEEKYGAIYLSEKGIVTVEGADRCHLSGLQNTLAVSFGTPSETNGDTRSIRFSYLLLDRSGSVYKHQFMPKSVDGNKNSRFHLWDDIFDISNKGYYAIGLRKDGTVVVDNERVNEQVSSWKNIIAISSGGAEYDHSVFGNHNNSGFWLGLTAKGNVIAYGNNRFGQCNAGNWENIVYIDAYDNYALGLREDGTVVACGENHENRCNVSSWNDIIDVSASYDLSLGLRRDGTVISTRSIPGLEDLKNIVGLSGRWCFGVDGVGIEIRPTGCRKNEQVKIWFTKQEREAYEAEKRALIHKRNELKHKLSSATGFFEGGQRKQIKEELIVVQHQLGKYPDI